MNISTKDKILDVTVAMMASMDPNNISIRLVSKSSGVQPSVIYHHYDNKDALLKAAFLKAQTDVRDALLSLKPLTDISQMLTQRLNYHFDNFLGIAAMLRYFLAFKSNGGEPGSYIPEQAYLHIKEVIDKGLGQGVYFTSDSARDSRVIVHSLNGFLLENFPLNSKIRDRLVNDIQPFIERALTNKTGGVPIHT